MKSNYSKQLTVMLSSLLFGVSLHFSAAANPILQQFKVNNSGFVGMMQGKDAEAKVKMPYTPNPDTVYSGLVADLTKEPLVLVQHRAKVACLP